MTDTYEEAENINDTPEEREFELRAHVGAIWTGGRLFIGIYTFMLAGLVFSYFYLRSSNNALLWRPRHVTAPTAFGWAIFSLVLLAMFMAMVGQRRLRRGAVLDWQVAIWVAVAASAMALFLQIWEFSAVPFYPGSSGYASTFIGYSVMNVGTLAVGTYWLETTVAHSLRLPKQLGGENPLLSNHPSAQSFRANVASMTYFWGFIGLSSALLFAMFYLL